MCENLVLCASALVGVHHRNDVMRRRNRLLFHKFIHIVIRRQQRPTMMFERDCGAFGW